MGIDLRNQYSPYTPKQAGRIRELWSLFRQFIGLEGDLGLKLRSEGKGEKEISEAIESHRKQTGKDKEEWQKISREREI